MKKFFPRNLIETRALMAPLRLLLTLAAVVATSFLLSGISSAAANTTPTSNSPTEKADASSTEQGEEGDDDVSTLADQSKIDNSLYTTGEYLPLMQEFAATDEGHELLYHEKTMKELIVCEKAEKRWVYHLADPKVENQVMTGVHPEDLFLLLDLINQNSSGNYYVDLPKHQELCTMLQKNPELFSKPFAEWTSDLVMPSNQASQERDSQDPLDVVFYTTQDSSRKAVVAAHTFFLCNESSPQVGFRFVLRCNNAIKRTDSSSGEEKNKKLLSSKASTEGGKTASSQTSSDSTKKSSFYSCFNSMMSSCSASNAAGMINGVFGMPLVSGETLAFIGGIVEEIVVGAVEGAVITAAVTAATPILGTVAAGGGIVEGVVTATKALVGLERGAATAATVVTDATTVTREVHILDDAVTEGRNAVKSGEKLTHDLSLKEPGSPGSPKTDLETPHSAQEPTSARSNDSGTSTHSTSADHISSPVKTASTDSISGKVGENLTDEEWEEQLNRELFEKEQRLGRVGGRAVIDDLALAAEHPDHYMTREEVYAERELYANTSKVRPVLTDRLTLSNADRPTQQELEGIYNPNAKMYPSISSNHMQNVTSTPKSTWSWPWPWGKR
ncbi:MAG: hypothetical protein ACOYK6_01895 [Chthoniobacterales bacterium]